MIVLDEDAVVKAEAMIGPTTMAHRFFFQSPPEGGGFAGIEQAAGGAAHGIHHLPRQSGDARQALQQVKGETLPGQQGRHGSFEPENRHVDVDPFAIAKETRDRDGRIDQAEDLAKGFGAGEHERFPPEDDSLPRLSWVNHRLGRHITMAEIFLKSQPKQQVGAVHDYSFSAALSRRTLIFS